MTVAELMQQLGIKTEPALWFTTEHEPVTFGEEFLHLSEAVRLMTSSMGAVGAGLARLGEMLAFVPITRRR